MEANVQVEGGMNIHNCIELKSQTCERKRLAFTGAKKNAKIYVPTIQDRVKLDDTVMESGCKGEACIENHFMRKDTNTSPQQ